MIRLTFPTLSAVAQALVAHRTAGAKALADWEHHHTKHGGAVAADLVSHCRVKLAEIDAALLELQAVAPPFLNDFLKQQIDLIQRAAPTTQLSTQEQP
jgi:hypothetical protein